MTAFRRTASFLVFTAFLLTIPTKALSVDDPSRIDWVGDFEGALTLAQKRMAPIFVTISEGDADLPATGARREYGAASVVDATRSFVCLIASAEKHAKTVKAEAKATCSRFPGLSCQEHIEVALALKKRSLLDPSSGDTGYLILDPAGELIDRHRPGITATELLKFMDRGLAQHRKTATATIIKSLKAGPSNARAAAFRDAVSLLTEDKSLKRLHDASAKYLKRIKSDEDSRRVRKIIAGANSEGALALLVPSLRDRSPRTRIDTLRVLASTEPRASLLADLAAFARVEKREDALQELVRVLDSYATKLPEGIKPLNKLIMHATPSVRVLATLAAARPANQAVYRELLKRSTRESHVAVRTAAILGLATMGAEEALPTLKKLQRSKGGRSDVARALDVAILKLSGSKDVAFDFEQEVEKLKNAVARTHV